MKIAMPYCTRKTALKPIQDPLCLLIERSVTDYGVVAVQGERQQYTAKH